MKKALLIFIPAIFVVVSAVVFLTAQKSSNTLQTVPTLFAEGVINTAADEYNPTFTPDGKTVYFTRRIDRRGNEVIMFSRLENGKWTTPQTAEFSGKFYDKEPMLSPDGKRIFFASERPNGRDEKANFDIWMAEKTDKGWGEAKNLGANVNSSGYDNYPSIAADGTLYFASVRQDGRKDNDLYRSRLVNGEYQKAENLGDIINTTATEADPFIAPDQSYLIIYKIAKAARAKAICISALTPAANGLCRKASAKLSIRKFTNTRLLFRRTEKFFIFRAVGAIFIKLI